VSFTDIAASSFNISITYFVMSQDNDVVLGVKEKINIAVMQIVAAQGCEFASATPSIQIFK
jgi:hypothetical protein